MSPTDQSASRDGSNAPFGTEQRRSSTPLIIIGALYVLWALALLWMALAQPGGA